MGKCGVLLVKSEVLRFLGVGELVNIVIELVPEVGVFLNVLDKDLLVIRQNRRDRAERHRSEDSATGALRRCVRST
jgi:hypothetical protein